MKILLYVNSHLPDLGGRELVVHNLALQYQAKGHEVVVAGPAGVRRHRGVAYSYPVIRWPSAPILVDQTRRLFLTCYGAVKHFDIVHCHTTYPCGYIAVKSRRSLGCPVIVTPHGEDINVVEEIDYGQMLNPQQAWKIKYAVQEADATTAISDTVEASLIDAGAPQESIHRIGNGVDNERFADADTEAALSHFDLPPQTNLMVTIGNYRPIKGHEYFIDSIALAHAKDPTVAAIIIGKNSRELRNDVKQKGYGKFIRFAGELPVPMPGSNDVDLLAGILAGATAYVSASISEGAEGLSLSLLEAMAAGACPIVTDISGNRDLIKNEQNGFVVPPRDPEAMATAVLKASGDDSLVQRLSSSARDTASEHSWSSVADQYLALYSSVAQAAD